MKIEHLTYNVSDPAGMADWYCRNLGMKIVRSGDGDVPVRFIRCDGGMMIELYNNKKAVKMDLSSVAPLSMHLAFEADDVAGKFESLVKAGAKIETNVETTPTGDVIAMLRDPWGLPIQLVRRAVKMG